MINLHQASVIYSNPLDRPALDPPPGVDPNFDHPVNYNALGYAFSSVFLAFTVFAIGIRCYARLFVDKKFHLGDYILLPAFGLALWCIYTLFNSISSRGFLVHQWDIRIRDFPPYLYDVFILTNVFPAFLSVMKVAILIEWIHIFVPLGTRTPMFWSYHAMIWIVVLTTVVILILINVSCPDYKTHWETEVPDQCPGRRLPKGEIAVALSGTNFVADVLIFILPQRTIWRLNMPTRQKLVISAFFAVGLIACIAGILRFALQAQLSTSVDYTFGFSILSLTAIVEGAGAVFVLCIPCAPKAISQLKSTRLTLSLKSWSSAEWLQNRWLRRTRHSTPNSAESPAQSDSYMEIDSFKTPRSNGGSPSPTDEEKDLEAPQLPELRISRLSTFELMEDSEANHSEMGMNTRTSGSTTQIQ
ncbi:hypothetical protein F4808DRAFT_435940 [Astrocystis sublimbata]|nr:hypothetical protein F4808DRAFT_435940 [Astrocystis sublimbata]